MFQHNTKTNKKALIQYIILNIASIAVVYVVVLGLVKTYESWVQIGVVVGSMFVVYPAIVGTSGIIAGIIKLPWWGVLICAVVLSFICASAAWLKPHWHESIWWVYLAALAIGYLLSNILTRIIILITEKTKRFPGRSSKRLQEAGN